MKRHRQNRGRKLLFTVLILGAVGSLAGIGTFSAFSSTTTNPDNNFTAGTVYLTDNDANTRMYNVTNAKPGDSATGCITVTYGGTLPSTVKLYGSGVAAALGPYVNLKVEQGSVPPATPFNDCSSFSATGTLYDSAIGSFPTTYAAGISTNPGAGQWVNGDSLSYRFTVTLADDNNANGQGAGQLSTGLHSYTWEARNV